MKIISICNYSNVKIEFQDNYRYITNTTYSNFQRGEIKNPYDVTIVGVGFIGDGKYKSWENDKPTVEYTTWKEMLTRCYYNKTKHLHNSYYKIATVCDEWHNFQNFAEWYNNNKYEVKERLHLDKDILLPGNKIYSPETCLLVPQRINMLFVNRPNKRGLPNGIHKAKNGYTSKYNNEIIGTYQTVELAFDAYGEYKEEYIQKIAKEYENVIPEKVYSALMYYKVKIEVDKNYKVS